MLSVINGKSRLDPPAVHCPTSILGLGCRPTAFAQSSIVVFPFKTKNSNSEPRFFVLNQGHFSESIGRYKIKVQTFLGNHTFRHTQYER
ncbi:hypothetical protein CEXT_809971 [Caerostris extrusa]|uniref:Uncharacterized protein n=1 Tax=Caerostris extrusa TaxID=172846 RepID=A0AAV4UDF0_CAEEX|nr:hypothetical protein CEXT_809971 [Caerostris extrusa]